MPAGLDSTPPAENAQDCLVEVAAKAGRLKLAVPDLGFVERNRESTKPSAVEKMPVTFAQVPIAGAR